MMNVVLDENDVAEKAKAWAKASGLKVRIATIRRLTAEVQSRLGKARSVDPKSLKKPISR